MKFDLLLTEKDNKPCCKLINKYDIDTSDLNSTISSLVLILKKTKNTCKYLLTSKESMEFAFYFLYGAIYIAFYDRGMVESYVLWRDESGCISLDI
jgi:hypothetical protein